MKNSFFIFLLLSLSSCSILRSPTVNITDKYLFIKNPGQSVYFAEVNPLKMDSIFHYPSKEEFVLSYAIVNRKSNRSFEGSKRIKMKFNRRNERYKWMIWKDIFDQDKKYADTISLKPFTWYAAHSSNSSWIVYIYWKGKPGDYIIKEKPKPGAW